MRRNGRSRYTETAGHDGPEYPRGTQSPTKIRINVDLPAALGPNIAIASPFSTLKLTLFNAIFPLFDINVRFDILRAPVGIGRSIFLGPTGDSIIFCRRPHAALASENCFQLPIICSIG